MKERTVRELGGEIWSEFRKVEGLDWRLQNHLVDIVMGVLARHDGSVIVNDKDLPVAPIPITRES